MKFFECFFFFGWYVTLRIIVRLHIRTLVSVACVSLVYTYTVIYICIRKKTGCATPVAASEFAFVHLFEWSGTEGFGRWRGKGRLRFWGCCLVQFALDGEDFERIWGFEIFEIWIWDLDF